MTIDLYLKFMQIKLLFQTGFDDGELKSYIPVIHANVYQTIKVCSPSKAVLFISLLQCYECAIDLYYKINSKILILDKFPIFLYIFICANIYQVLEVCVHDVYTCYIHSKIKCELIFIQQLCLCSELWM